jgi:hypothetical protein
LLEQYSGSGLPVLLTRGPFGLYLQLVNEKLLGNEGLSTVEGVGRYLQRTPP